MIGSLLLAAMLATQSNPHAGDPNAAESGRGTFRIHCSPCHGIVGKGGRGPDLTMGVYSAGATDADLYRVISEGVAGTEMGAFGHLGSDLVWRIVTYLRVIGERQRVELKGDPSSGERLFWGKGSCGQCHQVDNRGGRLGPELSRAGRTRSADYLREALVAPNADITPGYATVRVTKHDGNEIVGVQRGFDNFSAQLMDLSENFHSYLRSEVREVRREFRSVMPGDYERRLSAAEIDDLVHYLVTLRGAKKP